MQIKKKVADGSNKFILKRKSTKIAAVDDNDDAAKNTAKWPISAPRARPRAAENTPNSPRGGGNDGKISSLFTLKKRYQRRWNCSGIAVIADNGIPDGNKRFVGGGRPP